MIDDDEKLRRLKKLTHNVLGRELHTPMTSEDVLEILDARGDEWSLVWESIPTDQSFDALYSAQGYETFLYEGVIFEHKRQPDESLRWERDYNPAAWLVDHIPFAELAPLADLYTYSHGIEAGASPWLLFQYVVGIAVTSQGMGLNSLMGIGIEDAKHLGEALVVWSDYNDVADPYVELILMYGGEEG